MKKTIFMLLSIMLVASMTGCAGAPASSTQQDQVSQPSTISESQSVAESSVSSDSVQEVNYAAMIPDPELIFPNGTITITDGDGGKAYIFNVTGYADGEFESFVAGCKDLGFTRVEYETTHDKGQDFGAYTEDGAYWVQVNLDAENEIIYIICQESKK